MTRTYSASEFKALILSLPKNFYVYTLVANGVPFYVGKGCRDSSGVRALAHRKEATSRDDPKSRFMRRLWATGGQERYQLELMCNSEETAFFHEQVMITDYGRRCDGGTLFNRAAGGQGSSGFKATEATCRKMSQSRTGRPLSTRHRRAISAGRLVSSKVKAANQRRKVPVRIYGISYNCLSDAALQLGVCKQTLYWRLNQGWEDHERLV